MSVRAQTHAHIPHTHIHTHSLRCVCVCICAQLALASAPVCLLAAGHACIVYSLPQLFSLIAWLRRTWHIHCAPARGHNRRPLQTAPRSPPSPTPCHPSWSRLSPSPGALGEGFNKPNLSPHPQPLPLGLELAVLVSDLNWTSLWKKSKIDLLFIYLVSTNVWVKKKSL